MVLPVDEPFSFEVVGHRGYGGTTSENTLAALRRPIKEEVDFADAHGPIHLGRHHYFFRARCVADRDDKRNRFTAGLEISPLPFPVHIVSRGDNRCGQPSPLPEPPPHKEDKAI